MLSASADVMPVAEGELLLCPNCGAQNPFTYKFCYNCGYSVIPEYGMPDEVAKPFEEETPVVEEQVIEGEKLEMITCSSCGTHNPSTYKFCGVCGFELTTSQEEAPETPAEEVSPPEETEVFEEVPLIEEKEEKPPEEMAPVVEEQVTEEEKPEMNTCPNCGELNPVDYKFCGVCGFDLTISPEETPETPAEEAPPPEKEIKAPEKEPPAIEDVFIAEEEVTAPVRISTGIEGLDSLISGGLMKNKVYLISGEPGTGQTIFGLQYLYEGLKNGENGLYFSGDEKPDQLILDARSLGWDLTRFIEEKRLGLVDSSHHFYDLYTGKSKSIDNRSVMNDLTRQVKKVNARRLVIDPAAPLLTADERCTNIQEYLRNLIFTIESNLECTTLITSGNQTNVPSVSRYGIEELVTGGIFILSMDKRKRTGERVRTLFIPKMRGTSTDLKEHTFEIQHNKGIVLLD
jgi:circadian clock protein KaiC